MKPFTKNTALIALSASLFAILSVGANAQQTETSPAAHDAPHTHNPADSASTTERPAPSSSKTQSDWDRYRATANRSGVGEALAHKALSYRGVRYRMGGTTTNGIDCSGLTQAVYKKWGMLLPRTSTEQFSKGVRVLKDQLLPGDLVFFSNTYRRGISHVGIYVGDNHFVHAAGIGKGVILSSLAEAYFLNHYAGARRIALAPAESAKKPSVDDPIAD